MVCGRCKDITETQTKRVRKNVSPSVNSARITMLDPDIVSIRAPINAVLDQILCTTTFMFATSFWCLMIATDTRKKARKPSGPKRRNSNLPQRVPIKKQ